MKKYSKYIYIAAMTMAVGLSSCDSYLDKLPDNRMELDNADDALSYLETANAPQPFHKQMRLYIRN